MPDLDTARESLLNARVRVSETANTSLGGATGVVVRPVKQGAQRRSWWVLMDTSTPDGFAGRTLAFDEGELDRVDP